MRKTALLGFLMMFVLMISGCALTQDQKDELAKTLKQEVDSFIDNSVQSHWDAVYALTTGSLGSSDKLKENLQKSLPDGSVLTGGDIVSMAWEDDKTAKVKVNWAYRQENTAGYSSETFVWTRKGDSWQYLGRALR
jgi:hypothetical protein